MRFQILPATEKDARKLMLDVRAEDEAEWIAGLGGEVERHLIASCNSVHGFARVVYLGHDDPSGSDTPLLIWGASRRPSPLQGPQPAKVWLIGTNKGMESVVALHSTIRKELKFLDERFPHTVAYADDRNTTHHHWLEWLGWERRETLPMGVNREPFRIYERTSPCARL